VSIRIQRSHATVKDLHNRLQHAYRRDDVRLVRRITVVIDLLVHHVPVEVLHERWCALPKSVPRLPQRLAAGINTYKVNKCNLLTEFTPIYSIA